jgi:membrane protease YdiL (CAAX protease family)
MRRIIEYLLFCAFAVALMYFSDTIIIAVLTALFGNMSRVPQTVLSNLLFISPLFPLLLGVVAILRLRLAGMDLGELLGFGRKTLAGDAAIGLGIGLAGLALALISLFLLSPFLALPPFAQLPPVAHLYFATAGAIVPGICEELYFRGLLFKLSERASALLMVIGSALAFSLWHVATPIYLVHTFFLGLLLALAVVKRRRLAPAIIGHTLANALFGAWILAGMPIPAT